MDEERLVDQSPGVAVPAPRGVDDVGPSVLPGTRREWVTALGQVSGLLLALRQEEADGAITPDPFADGAALRAWSAVTRPVLADTDGLTVPAARPADLAVLAHAARVLAASLCRSSTGGPADVLVAALRDEAAVHEREPAWLVAQLARVHGVLSDPGASSAGLVWSALRDEGTGC